MNVASAHIVTSAPDTMLAAQHLLRALGALAGKVWRIGLMGHSSRQANIALCLAALETVISAR